MNDPHPYRRSLRLAVEKCLENEGISQSAVKRLSSSILDAIAQSPDALHALAFETDVNTSASGWAAKIDKNRAMIVRDTRADAPDAAPELFNDRADPNESAVDFLKRVWGPYRAYQYQVANADPPLMYELRLKHRHKLDVLNELIPGKDVEMELRAKALVGENAPSHVRALALRVAHDLDQLQAALRK